MQLGKSRMFVISIIVMAAILSVALVLTAVSVTSINSNILKRTERSASCTIKANELGEMCGGDHLIVTYKIGKKEKLLTCGDTVEKEETAKEPRVKFQNVDEDGSYTLLMLDPDAPSSVGTGTFFLHWAVTNIKAEALRSGYIHGTKLMDYMGPSPPSKVHRYQFILLDSTNQKQVKLESDSRNKFSLDDFAKKNDLCTIIGLFQFKVKGQ